MLLAMSATVSAILAGCGVIMPLVDHKVQDEVQEQISGVSEDAIVVQGTAYFRLNIYVIDRDGTYEARSIRAAENEAGSPVLSPDGKNVAFLSTDEGYGGATTVSDVYVMNPNGTHKTKITANNPFRYLDRTVRGQPAWSPDSARVAFTSYTVEDREQASSADPASAPAEEINGIYVADASGLGVPRMIRKFPEASLAYQAGSFGQENRNLTWSPDGEKIAFYDGGALYVLKDDVYGQWDLINELSSVRPAVQPPYTWSPDGKRIAYVGENGRDIYVVNADGTRERLLTHTSKQVGSPAWSPDGKRMAYVGENERDIYVVNVDGSGERRLAHTISFALPTNTISYPLPAWSPDSRKLGFFCPARPGSGEGIDLCMINADGTELLRFGLDVD